MYFSVYFSVYFSRFCNELHMYYLLYTIGEVILKINIHSLSVLTTTCIVMISYTMSPVFKGFNAIWCHSYLRRLNHVVHIFDFPSFRRLNVSIWEVSLQIRVENMIYIHTHTHTYIYIYISACVYVCVCMQGSQVQIFNLTIVCCPLRKG